MAKTHSSRPRPKQNDLPYKQAADRFLRVSNRTAWVAFAILTLIASARIALTYTIFHHTRDEPAHIACGMEYLDKQVYRYEAQHPPLGRVMTALFPYLAGVRSNGQSEMYFEGVTILFGERRYERTLALARAGILPLFWIASLAVFLLCRRFGGNAGAIIGSLLFTNLPPILAHAGLATTDMAVTAFLVMSFLTLLLWLDSPGLARSALFGAATGLAVLSKFSALAYFPAALAVAALVYFLVEHPSIASAIASARRLIVPLLAAIATGALVIWAGYRFSFGPVTPGGITLPAPELFQGVRQVIEHNRGGHFTYLLGETSPSGWWYFFPVVLAAKTPLAFSGLFLAGLAAIIRKPAKDRAWVVPAFSAGILAVAMSSNINLGSRHILPIYALASVVAMGGALALLSRKQSIFPHAACGVMLLWLTASSAVNHPDYLAFFSEWVGDQPERILVDSDLDWGQDIKRLAARLRELGVTQIGYTPWLLTSTAYHGFPPFIRSDPYTPAPGWNAVNLTYWKVVRLGLAVEGKHNVPVWPDQARPVERVGKSILLYYFPPDRISTVR